MFEAVALIVAVAIILVIGCDYKVLNENYKVSIEGIKKLKHFIVEREEEAKNKRIVFTVGEFRRMTEGIEDEREIVVTDTQVIMPGLPLQEKIKNRVEDVVVEKIDEVEEIEVDIEEIPIVNSRLAELLL